VKEVGPLIYSAIIKHTKNTIANIRKKILNAMQSKGSS
jgi:hypothetical protein